MTNTLRRILFMVLLNGSLFSVLMIGIQNSSWKNKVNLFINETVDLPVSFIIGVSFISGSLTGNLLSLINLKNKS